MALTRYLAMTGAEIHNCPSPPDHIAWMACHFSPYGTGISNVPPLLLPGSMLILNDRIPPQGHDPVSVAEQLVQAAEQLEVSRVLLDFQRPGDSLTKEIAAAVTAALPCPVAITAVYADGLDRPIFLTPQLHKPLSEQLEVWNGREVWLEAALDCQEAVLTEEGCTFADSDAPADNADYHTDVQAHCRYCIAIEDDKVRFTLWREADHLQALLKEAENLGIVCAVGLYQQLKNCNI